MAPKKDTKRTAKPVTEEPVTEEPEGNDGRVIDEGHAPAAAPAVTTTEEAEVDIEELPGGGTRETPRPSRRYSR